MINIFEKIENQSSKIFSARNSSRSIKHSDYVLGALRILFALLMLWRYSTSYQSSFLIENGGSEYYPFYLALYGFLLIGLATPLVSLMLIFAETLTPLYIEVQVNVLIPYLLLFLDSGARLSLDSLLGRYRPYVGKLEIGKAQIYLLWPYGIICLLAAYRHLLDPSWRSLEVGGMLFSSKVITLTNDTLIEAIKTQPLVNWILKLGIVVQLLWEVTFIPLIFFVRGQTFVFFYGVFFFLLTHFAFRLSSLGLLELIFWALVFHCEIGSFLVRGKDA